MLNGVEVYEENIFPKNKVASRKVRDYLISISRSTVCQKNNHS
jgi:hypothetical protein